MHVEFRARFTLGHHLGADRRSLLPCQMPYPSFFFSHAESRIVPVDLFSLSERALVKSQLTFN